MRCRVRQKRDGGRAFADSLMGIVGELPGCRTLRRCDGKAARSVLFKLVLSE
jgi:hypothetical protein